MRKQTIALAVLASAATVAFSASADSFVPLSIRNAKPMFLVLPPRPPLPAKPGQHPANLAQWNGSFVDLTGHTINYTMVGADPALSNTSTHTTLWIIPVVMKFGAANGNLTFNPNTAHWNGRIVTKQVLRSPICEDGHVFRSGAVNLGPGEYLDDFQRGNFWSSVSTNSGYHTVMDCTTSKQLPPLKITVSPSQGNVMNNPFGSGVVGTDTFVSFDADASAYIGAHPQITPDTIPLFLSYDIYLTYSGCCIGGYHTALGGPPSGQIYSYATFVDSPDTPAQDIDAVSHEVGEVYDDPFANNVVNCNDSSLMEVGDPLENDADYGDFAVNFHKITWHPQSLVYIPYFGAPTSTSANGWYALNNDIDHVCPGQ